MIGQSNYTARIETKWFSTALRKDRKMSINRSSRLLGVLAAAFLVTTASMAAAQEVVVLQADDSTGIGDKNLYGWQGGLKLNGTFALAQSSGVPGTTDGVNISLGYLLNSDVGYLSKGGTHEWANALSLELGYTRSSTLEKFVKSLDRIDFRTAYLYHIPAIPWFGPFVGARFTAPMLAGYDVRTDPVDVIRLEAYEQQTVDATGVPTNPDGTPLAAADIEAHGSADRIDLTDAFAPLILRQSAGVFAIPLNRPEFKVDTRLGFAAWESFGQNGYVIADNEATPGYLELRRIEDAVQLGGELGLMFGGIGKEILVWNASALFMMPFYQNTETPLHGLDLMNMEFEALLGINLNNYVGIAYTFKALKQPLIVDDWQIQNNLLVTIGFGFRRPSPPAPVDPCACPPPPPPAAPAPAAP